MAAKLTVEQAFDRVSTRLETMSREMKTDVETQLKALETKNDDATRAANEKLDAFAPAMKALQDEQTKLRNLIAKGEARLPTGDVQALKGLSLTRTLWEDESIRRFRTGGMRVPKFSDTIKVDGTLFPSLSPYERKVYREVLMQRDAEPVHNDDTVGDLVKPWYRPDFIDLPRAMSVLRQLSEVMLINSGDNVEFDRETGYSLATSKITAAPIATDTTIDVDEVSGFSAAPGLNVITITDGSNTETLTISSITLLEITFAPALANGYAIADTLVKCVTYDETPEGALAPRSLLEAEAVTVPVAKLPAAAIITLEKLQDAARLDSFLRTRLLKAMAEMEDRNGFYAPTGNAKMWNGLMTDAVIDANKPAAWSAQAANSTIIDYIMTAFYDLAALNYIPTTALLSVKAHKQVAFTKDVDRRYIYFINNQPGTPDRVHMLEVKMSTLLSPNDSLVADFMNTTTFYDRQQATIDVGWEDQQFRKQERTILATERVAFGIERPLGISKLTVDTAP